MVIPKTRVIARLDVKGPNLVKGIHLEGLRVLGNPSSYANYYYHENADEIFYMDVVASLYERNSLESIIETTAKSVFIPITVGGGIRTVEDISRVLQAGADKVCINTGAVKKPEFIIEAAKIFGSSTIVGALECIKQANGKYLAFVDNGREETNLEVVSWAKKLQDLGVGELVVTSVDREGTGEGVDLSLISSITQAVSIPVIAHGGVGKPTHAVDAAVAGASAVAVASVFHYEALSNNKVERYVSTNEGNTRFLSEKSNFKKITPCRVGDVKEALRSKGFPVREVSI